MLQKLKWMLKIVLAGVSDLGVCVSLAWRQVPVYTCHPNQNTWWRNNSPGATNRRLAGRMRPEATYWGPLFYNIELPNEMQFVSHNVTQQNLFFLWWSVDDEFRSLSAVGQKLHWSLASAASGILYLLADGSRVNRLQWVGVVFYLPWWSGLYKSEIQ